MKLSIDENLQSKCPDLNLATLSTEVQIIKDLAELWEEIDRGILNQQEALGEIASIAKMPAIRESRQGYKNCGKDPARYRLSAESLLRRVMQGKGLYKVNNVVDLLNLVSIRSGFSIGGYDLEKIEGPILAGIGEAAEAYEGIGRGALNIEFLPVLRDSRGAFGSPTSDSVRTMVTPQTTQFLMVFFAFGKEADLNAAVKDAEDLLKRFGGLN